MSFQGMEAAVVVEIDEEGEVVTVVEGVTAVAAVVGTVAEVEDMAEVATRPLLDQTSPSKRSIFDLRFPFMHISYYSAMQYCQPKSVFFCI